MTKRILTTGFDPDELAFLKRRSEELRLSMGYIIRQAVRKAMEEANGPENILGDRSSPRPLLRD